MQLTYDLIIEHADKMFKEATFTWSKERVSLYESALALYEKASKQLSSLARLNDQQHQQLLHCQSQIINCNSKIKSAAKLTESIAAILKELDKKPSAQAAAAPQLEQKESTAQPAKKVSVGFAQRGCQLDGFFNRTQPKAVESLGVVRKLR